MDIMTFLIINVSVLTVGFTLGVCFSHVVLGGLHKAVADVKTEVAKVQEVGRSISLIR